MPLRWDIPVYTPMIPAIELGALLEEIINLGVDLVNEPLMKKNKPHVAAIFGLACLAVRQTQAFRIVLLNGLEDQSITLARSLYESFINLYDITNSGADRDRHLPPPPSSAERKARQRAHEKAVRKRSKLFWDHHRVTNYRSIKEADKHLKKIRIRLDNLKPRLRACKDSGHASRLKHLRKDLENEVMAYKRLKKYNGKVCCSLYQAVKAQFGGTKPHTYWNNKSPSASADELGVNHSSWYQYCCNFSHSGAFAVRAILAERPDGMYMGPANLIELQVKLKFMATFLLMNCLTLVAHTIGDEGIDLGERISKFRQEFDKICFEATGKTRT